MSTSASPSANPLPMPWESDQVAANGKTIAENFAQWFEGSKVRLTDGAPMVVYHGSCYAHGFEKRSGFHFEAKGINDYGDAELGFFFAGQEVANTFAGESEDAMVLPVFLKIENPASFGWERWCEMLDELSYDDWHKMRRDLLGEGCDGIHIKGNPSASECFYGEQFVEDNWIAFHGHQIKSAIGNCGLYVAGSAELTDHETMRTLLRAQRAQQEVFDLLLARHECQI